MKSCSPSVSSEQHCAKKIFKMIRFTSNKSNFYLHQQCSVALKYAKNALAAGAPPWTMLGELTTLRPPSRLERGTPLHRPHPLGAFGASIFAPAVLVFHPEHEVPLFEKYRRPCPFGSLPIGISLRHQKPGVSGVLSVILRSAVLIQCRLVTDERTDDRNIYRASVASCCKNAQ